MKRVWLLVAVIYCFGIIVSANAKLEKARIRMGKADVETGNINRSPTSYLLNPEEEREKYKSDTDQEITVLRFDSLKGAKYK